MSLKVKSFFRSLFWLLPTNLYILLIASILYFIYRYGLDYNNSLESIDFNILIGIGTSIVILSIIILIQKIIQILHAAKRKEPYWMLLIHLFYIFLIPYYYLNNMRENKKDKIRGAFGVVVRKFLFYITIVGSCIGIIFISIINSTSITRTYTKEKFITKDNFVEFTAYSDFSYLADSGEYELYIRNIDETCEMGVYVYNKEEYEIEYAQEVIDWQVEYFEEDISDFYLQDFNQIRTLEDRRITSDIYNSEEYECTFIFSTIEFYENSDYVIYVLQIIVTDFYEDNVDELKSFLDTAKLIK